MHEPNTEVSTIFETGINPPHLLNSIKRDHDEIRKLHQEFKSATSNSTKDILSKQIMKGVAIHDIIEELVFYPVLKTSGVKDAENLVVKSLSDHGQVKSLLYELNGFDIKDNEFTVFFEKMMTEFLTHSNEEEQKIFPLIKQVFDENKLKQLGVELDEMRRRALSVPAPSNPDEPLSTLGATTKSETHEVAALKEATALGTVDKQELLREE